MITSSKDYSDFKDSIRAFHALLKGLGSSPLKIFLSFLHF